MASDSPLDVTEGGELIESETLRVERPAYQRAGRGCL